MVKPVILDFDYKTHNHQTNKISEPAISFIAILQETVQNKTESTYMSNKDSNTITHNDNNSNTTKVIDNKNYKNSKEDNTDTLQDVATAFDRKITDRRNFQKDDGMVQKLEAMQSIAPSLLYANTARAIVTDKNTPKQSVYKRDVHVRNFPTVANSVPEQVTVTNSITNKVGKESIKDVINQLQKLIDGNTHTKDAKKNDVKQLIANLTALQNSGKKDFNSALVMQHVVHHNELSDNKNKREVRKTDNDNVIKAADKSRKTVQTIETSIVDAVKQKGKLEETPKSDRKVSQTNDRNDSFIQVNSKQQNQPAGVTQAKPVASDELMQLLQKAKIMQEGEKTHLSLKLYPESLGKLSVNLGLEQGVLSGRFVVESQEAKELLLQQLDSIKWELEQNGVQVGDFEVNVKEQRQRDYTEMKAVTLQNAENTEYEQANNRYMYHDGVLDVII